MATKKNLPSSGSKITSVRKVGVMVVTDRREGLDPFNAGEFLRNNTLAQRLARLPQERRAYSLTGIVHHKSEKGHVEALRRLLTDVGFLATRLAYQTLGGLPALLDDYREALLAPGLEGLRPIQQALELSQYLLNDDPSQLPQQLVARLSPTDSSDVAQLLDAARGCPGEVSLLPISPSLSLPGGALQRSLTFNRSQLRKIVLLPDGECCVVADQTRISVREIASGTERADLGPHGDEVTALVYAAKRELVAAALREGPIPVWDLKTPRQLFQLPGHGRATLALAITPEGDLLSGGTDGAIHVWDLEHGRLARTLVSKGPSIHALALLPDGTVISGGGNHLGPRSEFCLYLWRLADGAALGNFGEHEWPVENIAATSDGKRVVSAANQTLKVWDLETRALHRGLEHTRRIHGLRTIPGRQMGLSTDNPDVMLWDLEEGCLVRRLRGHHALVSDVSTTPDGCRALSVSEDQTLKVWDLDRAQDPESDSGHDDAVRAVAFTLGGTLVVSASEDHSLRIWNVATTQPISRLRGHRHWVRDLAVSPDGRFVYSASWDGCVKNWNLATGSEVGTLKTPGESHLQAVAVTPDGRCVAGAYDGRLFLWNSRTSSDPRSVTESGLGSINSLELLDDGSVLAVADRGAVLWDLGTGQLRLSFQISPKTELTAEADAEDVELARNIEQRMNAVALLPEGRRVLIGTGSGHLVIWDLETGSEDVRWVASSCGITDVAVTQDGRFAVVASGLPTYASDNTVRVWDIERRRSLVRFVGETPMMSCSISPDGKTIVAGDAEGRVHFLSFRTHP